MKNLFDPATADDVTARIGRVKADTPRVWGTMSSAQMLAHCAQAMEMAVGDQKPPRMFIGRILGPVMRRVALGDDKPLARNTPTAKELLITGERDVDTERTRLVGLVTRFASGGAAKCTTHPHTFFGPLSPQQWAELMYKHTDHHLRQFGV